MKAYLASHFFDTFGYEGTRNLAHQIRCLMPEMDLYVPQENGEINDKQANDASITAESIYKADRDRLLSSDILIAYIDGVEIDAGVACEIGLFSGLIETEKLHEDPKRTIIGLYTDSRQHGTGDNHMYKNQFVVGAIKQNGTIVSSLTELLLTLQEMRPAYV